MKDGAKGGLQRYRNTGKAWQRKGVERFPGGPDIAAI